MWIQVRTMDGKETHRVDSLSKLTKVDDLRLKISELFKVEPDMQRLFYRGKQVCVCVCVCAVFKTRLSDGHPLLIREKRLYVCVRVYV